MGSVISSWAAAQSVTGTSLLDVTGLTGAVAAYSMARKLRAAYAGSCFRMRRSSDNAETNIGFAGNDVDEAAMEAFAPAQDGYVVTWYDQSPNGLNLTQPDMAAQPHCWGGAIEQLNGKLCALFDGADFMSLATNSAALNMTSATLMASTDNVTSRGKLSLGMTFTKPDVLSKPYYKGTWDADNNVPELASGVGTVGDLYLVSVSGDTVLDLVTSWTVGDYAYLDAGSLWFKFTGTTETGGCDGWDLDGESATHVVRSLFQTILNHDNYPPSASALHLGVFSESGLPGVASIGNRINGVPSGLLPFGETVAHSAVARNIYIGWSPIEDNPHQFYSGRFQELVIWPSTLSGTYVQNCENNVNAFYSIY